MVRPGRLRAAMPLLAGLAVALAACGNGAPHIVGSGADSTTTSTTVRSTTTSTTTTTTTPVPTTAPAAPTTTVPDVPPLTPMDVDQIDAQLKSLDKLLAESGQVLANPNKGDE